MGSLQPTSTEYTQVPVATGSRQSLRWTHGGPIWWRLCAAFPERGPRDPSSDIRQTLRRHRTDPTISSDGAAPNHTVHHLDSPSAARPTGVSLKRLRLP